MASPRPQQVLRGGLGSASALNRLRGRPVEADRAGSAGERRAVGRSAQARRAEVTPGAGAGAGAVTSVHVTYRPGLRGVRPATRGLRSRSRPGEYPSHSTLSRDLPRSMFFRGGRCCGRPLSAREHFSSLFRPLSPSCGCEAPGTDDLRGRKTRQTTGVLGNQAVSDDNNNTKK